jgi:hypothetical protein
MSKFTKTDAGQEYKLGMQALKRLAQPDDIGGVVAFLASRRWRFKAISLETAEPGHRRKKGSGS